jgi:hypothetical protein
VLLGGWQLQTIISFRSGIPFTPIITRDVANTGVGSQRPARLGACRYTGSLSQYFDVTAFAVPANFTYGNSGADICRSDLSKASAAVTEPERLRRKVCALN